MTKIWLKFYFKKDFIDSESIKKKKTYTQKFKCLGFVSVAKNLKLLFIYNVG